MVRQAQECAWTGVSSTGMYLLLGGGGKRRYSEMVLGLRAEGEQIDGVWMISAHRGASGNDAVG